MKLNITLKKLILEKIIKILRNVYGKTEGKELLFKSIPYINIMSNQVFTDLSKNYSDPYRNETITEGRKDVKNCPNVVFISGRFRSGSTLLWNIFRDIPNTTSYYEPFNERQWFNREMRGNNIDNTHLGVDDYWKEYDDLDALGKFYKDSWEQQHFYMNSRSWEPDMLNYIDELIRSGKERVVLQFNRLDFRLEWIRHYYPNAHIIHVYRHPREQWVSSVKNSDECSPQQSIKSLGNRDFFYIRRWGRDLRYVYPFLDESSLNHLYELFYLIWRLSYNHGLSHADYSFSIEDLCENPESILKELFDLMNVDQENIFKVQKKILRNNTQKWMKYADDDWFNKMEVNCENILSEYFHSYN